MGRTPVLQSNPLWIDTISSYQRSFSIKKCLAEPNRTPTYQFRRREHAWSNRPPIKRNRTRKSYHCKADPRIVKEVLTLLQCVDSRDVRWYKNIYIYIYIYIYLSYYMYTSYYVYVYIYIYMYTYIILYWLIKHADARRSRPPGCAPGAANPQAKTPRAKICWLETSRKSPWTWELRPSESRFCLSRTLRDPGVLARRSAAARWRSWCAQASSARNATPNSSRVNRGQYLRRLV